jgi:UDP-4-amino-4,6-dideoxy-N-acetyl-beta-L-altrosamine transaminase
MKPINYGRHHITEQDIAVVAEALRADYLTQGPRVERFEQAFRDYLGSRFAVANASGTASLHLAAMAAGIGPGDRVITTPITFVASANCALFCGAQVEFVDIDPKTFLMDLDLLERKLYDAPKGHYKAVIPVDFAGYPIDAERLSRLAGEYGFTVIEDACHAPGAWFTDSKGVRQGVGNGVYSDLAVFSFHPVKHIACGEGGMVTTGRQQLFDRLMLLRSHGITKVPEEMEENHGGWYYEMQELSYNYRMTDFQAALGFSQLSQADRGLARRRAIAERYNAAFSGTKETFSGTEIEIPYQAEDIGHAFHLYVIQYEKRRELYDELRKKDIFAQVHYIPVHLQPYYRRLGWKKGDFPQAERYYDRCLSLPMYPALTDEQQQYVIDRVLDIVKGLTKK